MVNIKPDEISAILTQQLSGQKTQAELEQIGTVLQYRQGIWTLHGRSRRVGRI